MTNLSCKQKHANCRGLIPANKRIHRQANDGPPTQGVRGDRNAKTVALVLRFRLRICIKRAGGVGEGREKKGKGRGDEVDGCGGRGEGKRDKRHSKRGVKPAAKAEEEPLCTSDVCVGQVPVGAGQAWILRTTSHTASMEWHLLEPVTHSRRYP